MGSIHGASYYTIVDGPTWEEAEANAVKLGGHLVTINDAEENEFLATNPYFLGNHEFIFYAIGITDKYSEGTWSWIDGDQSTFRSWDQSNGDGKSEPNGNDQDGSDYGYLGRGFENNSLYKTENSGLEEGSWYDDWNNSTVLNNGITVKGIAEIPRNNDAQNCEG